MSTFTSVTVITGGDIAATITVITATITVTTAIMVTTGTMVTVTAMVTAITEGEAGGWSRNKGMRLKRPKIWLSGVTATAQSTNPSVITRCAANASI
jgi:hypothetical protein